MEIHSEKFNLEQFPKEVVNDMFVLLETPGCPTERILGAFNSEIEAFKIYKNVSHNDKIIIKANVIYIDMFGLKSIYGYEEI